MVTFVDLDVREVLVSRQHVGSFALLKEVNRADLVFLLENLHVFNQHQRLEQRTDPHDEVDVLLLPEE